MNRTAGSKAAFGSIGRRSNKRQPKAPRILNEGPDVIGLMTVSIENDGSLDSAVRTVAREGPPISAALFTRIADMADVRMESDMKMSISDLISNLPQGADPYGMALHMLVSASDAKDKSERDRMLREASDISLSGLRDAGKTYSASLNMPCMIIFGVGIMVPMVLMSVLPMLSIGGLFGTSVDMAPISALTLILIPAFVIAIMAMIKEKNPFMSTDKVRFSIVPVLPFLSAVPLFAVLFTVIGDLVMAAILSLISAGILTFATVYPSYRKISSDAKRAAGLEDMVFEVGNRLISGSAFEDAVIGALSSRAECRETAHSFRQELEICRGDIESAVRNALSPVSESVAEIYCKIYRISCKDLRDAGKLALSIGRQLKDQQAVRRNIRTDLKNLTDTMFGTAAVFAPLILGLGVSLLEPMETLAEGIDVSGTASVLTVYLVELCALIAVLVSFLDGKVSFPDIVRRFSVMIPISMSVFLVSMSFAV